MRDPDPLRKPPPDPLAGQLLPPAADPGGAGGPGEVGDFRQGRAEVRWALARYLVGRVILGKVSLGLLFTAALIGAAGIAMFALGLKVFGVLILLAALAVLLVRWVFAGIVRRVSAAASFGPAEEQVRRLLADTGGDLRRELRRVGVPSGWWSFPLLLARLIRSGPRRAMFARMRA
ncbi:MAG: hypothetical protein LBQ06_01580, partial [Frankiaceae bacterium]|nr:hypothetical protein [Frankiaceae bacterium]